jgi:hypothetical protein
MIWKEFRESAPEMAELGEERFERTGLVLVGTICRDGSPRISPVEPLITEGHLFLGMMWQSMKALDLLRRGGRLVYEDGASAADVPVLALTPEGVKVVGVAKTLDEAVAAMAAQIESAARAAPGRKLRVGIGHGGAPEIASALRSRVAAMSDIGEIVDYVVGPSIGAHAGAGNAGAVFIPRPVMA